MTIRLIHKSSRILLLVYVCCCVCISNAKLNDSNIPGLIRLSLSETVYAVAGIETNIYFDNIVLAVNPSNYIFDVTCEKGIQQAERWVYKPLDSDVGIYPIMIEVKDQSNYVVAVARANVYVVPADSGKNTSLTMLCIGDSLTQASKYTHHLLELSEKTDNPEITLVGSHSPNVNQLENKHEGYGGWTAKRFATLYTGVARKGDYAKRGSPFIYKSGNREPELVFLQYCKEFNDSKTPDFVTIFLGANDVFSANDRNIESRIDEMLKHYDTLVNMVHELNSEAVIGVLLPIPPASSQDTFGANYGCGQTRWQYKRNQHRLVERMLKHYGKREAENVYIVPTNVNLDCEHNYPMQEMVCNGATSEQIMRLTNALHPAEQGYHQIGDTIYCWLKARLYMSKK